MMSRLSTMYSLLRRHQIAAFAVIALVAALLILGATGGYAQIAALLNIASSSAPAPADDSFADAAVIAPGATVFEGSTDGATAEDTDPGAGSGDQTVWFTWAPAQSGTAYLLPNTAIVTDVRIYVGDTPQTLQRLDTPSSTAHGGVVFAAVAGTTYRVLVDTPADQGGGAFQFSIWQPTPGGPDNDAFRSAAAIEPAIQSSTITAPLQGTTVGATTEPNEPAGVDRSVWYVWTPAAAQSTLHVSVTPSTETLGAFGGRGITDLTTLQSDQSGNALVAGTPGSPVYLRVGGPAASFSLTASITGGIAADATAPVITCSPPTDWTSNRTVSCTAKDTDSGLANPADAAFVLTVQIADGQSSAAAPTGAHTVCDVAGNCAVAGPYKNLKIDQLAPTIDCDPVPPVWSGAQVTVACRAADTSSGLADGSTSTFTLTTAVAAGTVDSTAVFTAHAPVCDKAANCASVPTLSPVQVDLAAPVITCTPTPSTWLHDEAVVTCTSTDSGSGLADPAQVKFSLQTTVTDGTSTTAAKTNSAKVCDQVGNCSTVGPLGPIQIDRQAPAVHCVQPTGWHGGASLAVHCTTSDPAGGSGLANSADASFDLTATIAAGSQSSAASTGSRTICDVAGNCATAGPITGIELDDQAPLITCQPTSTAWSATAVHVDCVAADAGSGVNASDTTFTLSADIADGTASSTVALPTRRICDAMGNCATSPHNDAGKEDRAAPKVVCVRPTGTQYAEVTVQCTATDEGSGLADQTLTSFTLRTDVGAGNHDSAAYTNNRTVCDVAGNCTTAGPVGPIDVKRDGSVPGSAPALTVPTIVHVLAARPLSAFAVNASGGGAVTVPYALPQIVASNGIAVREQCAPNGAGLFAIGVTTVVCAAQDDADRRTTKTFPVSVTPAPDLAFSGPILIGSPLNVIGTGFAPNTTVTIEVDGIVSSSGKSADGTFSGTATIPAGSTQGQHQVVLRGTAPDGQPQLVVIPLVATDSSAVAISSGPTLPTSPPTTPAPTVTPPPSATALPSSPAVASGSTTGSGGSTSGTSTSPKGTGSSSQASTQASTGTTPSPTQATGPPIASTAVPKPSPAASQTFSGPIADNPSHGHGFSLLSLIALLVLVLIAGYILTLVLRQRQRSGNR
jgi:hypothetical protein